MRRAIEIGALLVVVAAVGLFVGTPLFVRQPHIAGAALAAGELRSFAAAQHAYAAAAGDEFGRIECLVSPRPPCPAASAKPFLDRRFLEPVRAGYRFELRLGPPGSRGFVYAALPVTSEPGATRALCIDASGEVRSSADARLTQGGGADRCDPALPVLR